MSNDDEDRFLANVHDHRGHRGNPNLKEVGVKIDWTPDLVQEYIKCSKDPLYFIRTYMRIVTKDDGLVHFDLYPYQEAMVNSMHHNRFSIFATARQAGKCLCINTPIRLRNKKSGEIIETTIGDFFELIYQTMHGLPQDVSNKP